MAKYWYQMEGWKIFMLCAFSGTSNYARYVPTPYTGRAIVRRIKQLLTENKIAVTSSTNCGT